MHNTLKFATRKCTTDFQSQPDLIVRSVLELLAVHCICQWKAFVTKAQSEACQIEFRETFWIPVQKERHRETLFTRRMPYWHTPSSNSHQAKSIIKCIYYCLRYIVSSNAEKYSRVQNFREDHRW